MEALANRESCLMCWPFLPMMAPTAWAGMNTWTISCSGACCQDRRLLIKGPGHGARQDPEAPPLGCLTASKGNRCRYLAAPWAIRGCHKLFSSLPIKGRQNQVESCHQHEGRCLSWAPLLVAGVLATEASLPSLLPTSQALILPQAQVISPSTYHEGAIGSSPSDAAGGRRDSTGRSWEETYSSQVETRDEVGLQL